MITMNHGHHHQAKKFMCTMMIDDNTYKNIWNSWICKRINIAIKESRVCMTYTLLSLLDAEEELYIVLNRYSLNERRETFESFVQLRPFLTRCTVVLCARYLVILTSGTGKLQWSRNHCRVKCRAPQAERQRWIIRFVTQASYRIESVRIG